MQEEVFVEVSKSALKHNFREVSKLASTPVLAVVKANGYGHGLVESARAFAEEGAWGLGVTRLSEAAQIRRAGINLPVLVFSPILPENAPVALDLNVIPTVDRLDTAAALSLAADAAGSKIDVHLKVDTGMGRLGVKAADAADFAKNLLALPSIRLAGVYTHFAGSADRKKTATEKQLQSFKDVLAQLKAQNIEYGIAHCANSAAIISFPEARMDLVRAGTVLYGQFPSHRLSKSMNLRQPWRLKARVVDMHEIPAGYSIGYGYDYTAKRRIMMAVVPVGWADGYAMTPEGPVLRWSLLTFLAKKRRSTRYATLNSTKVEVLGRVSMQLTCLDVTDVKEVRVGDIAELPAMRIPVDSGIPRIYTED